MHISERPRLINMTEEITVSPSDKRQSDYKILGKHHEEEPLKS